MNFDYVVEYYLDNDFMSNSIGCHTLSQAKEIGKIICDRALKSTDNVKVWIKYNNEVCYVIHQELKECDYCGEMVDKVRPSPFMGDRASMCKACWDMTKEEYAGSDGVYLSDFEDYQHFK